MLHGLPSYFAQFHSPSVAMRAVVATLRRPATPLRSAWDLWWVPRFPKSTFRSKVLFEGRAKTMKNPEAAG